MHGYFMDIRLFRKAKQLAEPFNYEEYKKNKIKESIDKERINRVKVRKLPRVNAELARKVIEDTKLGKAKKTNTNIMDDDRFTALFADPNYQIDKESEEFRLLNPVVQKMNEKKTKFVQVSDGEDDDDGQEVGSEDDEKKNGSESSSDDEHTWKDYKKEFSDIQKEKKSKNQINKRAAANEEKAKQPKFYEIKEGLEYFSNNTDILKNEKLKKLPIEKRMQMINKNENDVVIVQNDSIGNKQMTFLSKKVKRFFDYFDLLKFVYIFFNENLKG
jgi:ribosome biogenesis protein ENP2